MNMSVATAIQTYPNKFLLLEPVVRDKKNIVLLANVRGVCSTKLEMYILKAELAEQGIKTFMVPSFSEEVLDSAITITLSGDEDYTAEPFLTPFDSARMFRDYFGMP